MKRTGFTRRLEALESKAGSEQSALVRIPKHWSVARRKLAFEKFRADAGLTSEVQIDVQETDTVQDPKVAHLRNISPLAASLVSSRRDASATLMSPLAAACDVVIK